MKSPALIALVIFAYSAYACNQPIFRIYEADGDGEILKDILIVVDDQNVTHRGINNTNVYTCAEGLWMGYQYEVFGGESYFVIGGVGGFDECKQENGGRTFKSMKVVGAPDDYTSSAVMTFQLSNNQWASWTMLEDTEQLNNTRFNSMILTGNEEVEIFAESEFRGSSFCIRPNNGMIHNAEEFDAINDRLNGTELYTDLLDLTEIFSRNEFNSLKFGCGDTI